jgi:arylformamidase
MSDSEQPLVWGTMTQRALDDAYDQSVWAQNIEQLGARRKSLSVLARERLGPPARHNYGPSPVEAVEIFVTARPNAPIVAFVHGGAWRAGAAADYAFAAETFINAGAHFVALDFTNIDAVNGDLMVMARQVRAAIAWIYRNAAATFGGDPNKLYVAGHSSGGHLGGTLVTADWPSLGLPKDVIKGGVLASGMYDLKPVRLSKRSEYVKFTDEIEEELSAQRHLDRLHCPVTLIYGTKESPEFQRQSRDFAAAIEGAGKPVTLIRAEHFNHFEIPETLGNPYGLFGRAVLARMGLAQP